MPSAIQRRRNADPAKELRAEINACLKELNGKRREVVRLEEKLQTLLTKHLELVDGLKL